MENIPSPKKTPSFVKWALILGIAIVINLFLTYLVRVIYHEPAYTDFCPEKQVHEAIETKEECLQIGGQWNENIETKAVPQPAGEPFRVVGYCNENFICDQQFQDTNRVYNRNVFVVFVIAGMLLLIGSAFLAGAETISLALSFGGVLALIIGSIRYWSDMNDILRVVILGVALVALIFVAWKKFRD